MSIVTTIKLKDEVSREVLDAAFESLQIIYSPKTIGGNYYYHKDGCEISTDTAPPAAVSEISFSTMTSLEEVKYQSRIITDIHAKYPIELITVEEEFVLPLMPEGIPSKVS